MPEETTRCMDLFDGDCDSQGLFDLFGDGDLFCRKHRERWMTDVGGDIEITKQELFAAARALRRITEKVEAGDSDEGPWGEDASTDDWANFFSSLDLLCVSVVNLDDIEWNAHDLELIEAARSEAAAVAEAKDALLETIPAYWESPHHPPAERALGVTLNRLKALGWKPKE